MALGVNYNILHTLSDYTITAVGERGGVVCLDGNGPTTGDPGDPGRKAKYQTDPANAKPIGLLFQTVVAEGTWITPETRGFYEIVNRPAYLIRCGLVETNLIPGSVSTIVADTPAYLAADGKISNVQATNAPRVGTWKSSLTNGYAAVQIELV